MAKKSELKVGTEEIPFAVMRTKEGKTRNVTERDEVKAVLIRKTFDAALVEIEGLLMENFEAVFKCMREDYLESESDKYAYRVPMQLVLKPDGDGVFVFAKLSYSRKHEDTSAGSEARYEEHQDLPGIEGEED